MTNELPDVKDDIKRLRRQETVRSPWFIGSLIVVSFLCVVVLVGGSYFLPKITSILAPTGIAVNKPTETFTAEPTVEVTQELERTPTKVPAKAETTEATTSIPTGMPAVKTAESALTPTNAPIVGRKPTLTLTDSPTVEIVKPPPPPEEPSLPSTIDPATLPGKIAAPAFNAKTKTYDLYIASAPDWQPKLFQPSASQPTFSPDGTKIIFRSWGGSETSYSEQLVLRALDGSYDQLITDHVEDARPHWPEHDLPIVFHSRLGGDIARVYLQGIWEGALGDPNSRSVLPAGENPTWLPGERIVYASCHPRCGLYVMNRNGKDIRLIWPSSGLVAPKGATYSSQVVFSYNDDIYLLTVTEGQSKPQPLLNTSEHERLPVWSPDGQFIAYVTDRDGNWAVYAMRADGTGRVKLFDLPGSIDGKPSNVPPDRAFGWYEEQLAWGR